MTIMGPTTVRSCPRCSQLIRQDSYLSGNDIGARYWTDGYAFGTMLPYSSNLVKCPTCSHVFWISKAKKIGEYDSIYVQYVELTPEELEELQEESRKFHRELWVPTEEEKGDIARHQKLYAESIATEDPNESDYLGFIKNKKLTSEQERYLRMSAWRKANDKKRSILDNELFGVEAIKYFTGKETKWEDHFINNSEKYSQVLNVNFSDEQIDNLKNLNELLEEADPHQQIMKAEIARELGDFDEAHRLLNTAFSDEYIDQLWKEINEAQLSSCDEEFKGKAIQELYDEFIQENFGDTISVIKTLCNHKIVCVADIYAVLYETET